MKILATVSKLITFSLLVPLLAFGTTHASSTAEEKNGLIAYTKNMQGKNSIWVMSASGAHPRFITNDFAQYPVWSPDGRTLAFTAGGANTCNTRLVVMTASTLQQRTLMRGDCIGAPSWSANSKLLAFSQTQKEPYRTKSALFTIHTDTQRKALVADWSTSVMFRSPSWSPDNNRIVFEQYNQASSSLHIANLSSRTTRILTTLSDIPSSSRAAWSPSGNKIAYADSNNEIYTIWPDGSHRSVISDGDSYDAAWSPSGTELLFLEDRTGEALSRSQPDGTVVWLPLSLGGYVSVEQPRWSPDSSKVLLVATTQHGRKDLVSIELNNSQSTPTVFARHIAGSASWQVASD